MIQWLEFMSARISKEYAKEVAEYRETIAIRLMLALGALFDKDGKFEYQDPKSKQVRMAMNADLLAVNEKGEFVKKKGKRK